MADIPQALKRRARARHDLTILIRAGELRRERGCSWPDVAAVMRLEGWCTFAGRPLSHANLRAACRRAGLETLNRTFLNVLDVGSPETHRLACQTLGQI